MNDTVKGEESSGTSTKITTHSLPEVVSGALRFPRIESLSRVAALSDRGTDVLRLSFVQNLVLLTKGHDKGSIVFPLYSNEFRTISFRVQSAATAYNSGKDATAKYGIEKRQHSITRALFHANKTVCRESKTYSTKNRLCSLHNAEFFTSRCNVI